jgi:hypothetical protein
MTGFCSTPKFKFRGFRAYFERSIALSTNEKQLMARRKGDPVLHGQEPPLRGEGALCSKPETSLKKLFGNGNAHSLPRR